MQSKQIPLAISFNDKSKFDNFLVGNNQELVNVLRDTTQTKQTSLLYIYAAKGSGKSHLLFSVINLAEHLQVEAIYLDLSNTEISPEMLNELDSAFIICLDNVHTWSGDDEKEKALFTLIEQVKHNAGSLIISSEQPPEKSHFVLKDLVSRLNSGLIYALRHLSVDQIGEAIKSRALDRGIKISDSVIKFLLNHSSRDINDLFLFLDKVDKASLREKRKITIPFLQTLLTEDD